MKTYFFFALLLSLSVLNAQNNLDNTWIFGYSYDTPYTLYQGSLVNFENSSPIVNSQIVGIFMDFANTSMCDTEGNLLYYTNGRYVGDAEHNIMANGDSLNLDYMLGSSAYLILTQGVITVPMPGSPGQYYLFHSGMITITPEGILNVASHPLFYSVVDMTDPDYPLGIIKEKNTVILSDTLDTGKLTMT